MDYQYSLLKAVNMKKILGILAIVFLISGCNRNAFFEKIGLEEKITHVIQIRNDIIYLPNTDTPFTGQDEIYYLNGQKKTVVNYQNGKKNGLTTDWYENGQKEGTRNGLATEWYKNGQKESETYF